MKNVLFGLIATVMISFNGFANQSPAKLAPTTENTQKIKLELNLGNLNDISETEMEARVNDFLAKNLSAVDDELDCSVTVTGSVTVGFASFEVSVTVSGPCSEIKKAGGAIANDILDQVKAYIKKNM